MADAKISALPAASTPLAGTEVLPIVQSGVTDKVAVSDLTAGRAVSAASLVLTTTPLVATSGGTGQASYAVGDLLYASTTSALSRLADVATGNALLSGGVGVAPAWGQIGLTTHVTGTLPVANGGTAVTSFTANGVLYASSTSQVATGSGLSYTNGQFRVTGSIAGGPVLRVDPTLITATDADGATFSPTGSTSVTSTLAVLRTSPAIAAGAQTLSAMYHLIFGSASVGAGATLSNQVGVELPANFTAGTNNYAIQLGNIGGAAATAGKTNLGVRCRINIASGGGTAWGWFGEGTAPNAFSGLNRFGGTTAPVNTVDITGSLGRGAPVTKTADFTLAATENWVIVNNALGTTTVTLPSAASWTGREVMIKSTQVQLVISASSNVVPLAGGAAGTAILAATAGKWATLVSDGTNWVIMQGN